MYFQNFLVQLQGSILFNQGLDFGAAGVENLILFGMLLALTYCVSKLGTMWTYIFSYSGAVEDESYFYKLMESLWISHHC